MKPVLQTIYGSPLGNCLQACIATIFETDLNDVPNFAESGKLWFDKLTEFLEPRGITPFLVNRREGQRGLERGFSIISGPSPRGDFNHAVVAWDGVIIHDPHETGEGILKEWHDEIVFVLMNPGPEVLTEENFYDAVRNDKDMSEDQKSYWLGLENDREGNNESND